MPGRAASSNRPSGRDRALRSGRGPRDELAAGSSGTSEPWYLFLPFQLVMVSPMLVPLWAAGWWLRAVVAVGVAEEDLRPWFGTVEPAARVDDGVDLENEEQGRTVWLAGDRRVPWSEIWPQLRRFG